VVSADRVSFSAKIESNEINSKQKKSFSVYIIPEEKILHTDNNKNYTTAFIWNKLYDIKLFKNIKWKFTNCRAEDVLLNLLILPKIKKVCTLIGLTTYYHRKHKTQTSSVALDKNDRKKIANNYFKIFLNCSIIDNLTCLRYKKLLIYKSCTINIYKTSHKLFIKTKKFIRQLKKENKFKTLQFTKSEINYFNKFLKLPFIIFYPLLKLNGFIKMSKRMLISHYLKKLLRKLPGYRFNFFKYN
jgi:hypothetical protein